MNRRDEKGINPLDLQTVDFIYNHTETATGYIKLPMAIKPAHIIKMPVTLLTHFNPSKLSFFLNCATVELRSRNHKAEPVKTPATRSDEENKPSPFVKPNAENTAIKAKIVNGFVSVRNMIEIYVFNFPPM